MNTILIVDDDTRIVRILELQLNKAGYRTLTADNGRTAVTLAQSHDIDLVLLDVMMPIMNGIDAMREIKKSKKQLPIILLTAKDDTDDIVFGLDSGADEYVTKPFVFEELHARIRARLRAAELSGNESGGNEPGSSDISYKMIRICPEKFEVLIDENAASLSKTEFDLLLYLVRNIGRVVSREELLENVWGYSYGGSNIVDVYINYLREKIARHTSEKIIETVRGRGYIIQ